MLEHELENLEEGKATKWEERFIRLADHFATWSEDPSTQCAAVVVRESDKIILAVGYNGLTRGVHDTPEKWEKPRKYSLVEHGERNAIYNAARAGISLVGSTMYLNYSPDCCTDCARAIVQSGVARVVGPDIPFPGVGLGVHYSNSDSFLMLYNGGVTRVRVQVPGYLPYRRQVDLGPTVPGAE